MLLKALVILYSRCCPAVAVDLHFQSRESILTGWLPLRDYNIGSLHVRNYQACRYRGGLWELYTVTRAARWRIQKKERTSAKIWRISGRRARVRWLVVRELYNVCYCDLPHSVQVQMQSTSLAMDPRNILLVLVAASLTLSAGMARPLADTQTETSRLPRRARPPDPERTPTVPELKFEVSPLHIIYLTNTISYVTLTAR